MTKSNLINNNNIYSIIDIETTGLSPTCNEIISLSVGVLDHQLNRIKEKEFYFKSEQWNEEAEKIHRISRHENLMFPSFNESFAEFINFLPERSYFVCHAKKWMGYYFDYATIKNAFLRFYDHEDHTQTYKRFNRVISTHTMASDLVNKQVISLTEYEKPFYGLKNLTLNFNIELDHHEVRSDRIATEKLFKELMQCYQLKSKGLNHFQQTNSKQNANAQADLLNLKNTENMKS